jgi:hypothetical protein
MSKEAMKLALGALEWITQQRTGGMIQRKATEATTAIKQALEQPVQEPVAWMHTMIDDVVVGHRPADLNVHPDRWMPLYKDPTPCQTCEALARTVMMDQTAHDTTPPAAQRPWVGLTDEEISEAYNAASKKALYRMGTTREDVYEAIEAKLKEKNT